MKNLLKMNKTDFQLADYLNEKRDIINRCLEHILIQCNPDLELTRAMTHSLMAGGKRLRPVLCMASASAVSGADYKCALPAACAIEMIHTYSLIHDDLPAMDNDDLRRGLPTCHKAFSEPTAILAGDALLTHAFRILATPGHIFSEYPDKSTLLDLVGMIADAAGVNGMVEGQMMDMQASTKAISPPWPGSFPLSQELPPLPCSGENAQASDDALLTHLKTLHRLKTGRMIRISVECGAVSVNAGMEQVMQLSTYGEKIGLAFQVVDDILNIEGDPSIMGKAAGSDALNDKLTFPSLLGLEASRTYASRLVDEAIEALTIFDEAAAMPLKSIAAYIIKRKR